MKNLYLLSNGLDDYYVLATSPTHAQEKLETLLYKADYGFYHERKVKNIKLLAEPIGEFPEGRPNFSSGNTLIL